MIQSSPASYLGSVLDSTVELWSSKEFQQQAREIRVVNSKKNSESTTDKLKSMFPKDKEAIQTSYAVAELIQIIRSFGPYVREVTTTLQSYIVYELENFTHLGPLRFYPDRVVEGEPLSPHHNEFNGEASWLKLLDDEELLEKVNRSLFQLGMHYQVEVSKLYDDQTMRKILKSPSKESREKLIHRVKPSRRELRLRDTKADLDVSAQDVGVGVSQVLPVIIGLYTSPEQGLMSVEQPELHLHPKLQTELADIFVQAANSDRTVLFETHSEHLLLRLLRRIRETAESHDEHRELSLTANDVNIVFVENRGEGSKLRTLSLTPTGDFVNFWPEGFLVDRTEELF